MNVHRQRFIAGVSADALGLPAQPRSVAFGLSLPPEATDRLIQRDVFVADPKRTDCPGNISPDRYVSDPRHRPPLRFSLRNSGVLASMHHPTHDLRNRLPVLATIALLSLGSAALAGDSFLRSTRGLTNINDRATDIDRGDVSKARLREGTLVPPTPGRIMLIGRRWAFIPARPDAAQSDPLAMTGELTATSLPVAARPESASSPFGYRSSTDPSVGGKRGSNVPCELARRCTRQADRADADQRELDAAADCGGNPRRCRR